MFRDTYVNQRPFDVVPVDEIACIFVIQSQFCTLVARTQLVQIHHHAYCIYCGVGARKPILTLLLVITTVVDDWPLLGMSSKPMSPM